MNTQNKSNLIATIVLALAPFAPLALLLPAGGDIVAGLLVVAALAGLGVMELRLGAYEPLPGRSAKARSKPFRQLKPQA